jgi:hypothetical protein
MKLFRIALIASLLLIAACASQRPPTGGPEDKVPPHVIGIYPDSNAVRFAGTKLRFKFDKYISHSSLPEASFISPTVPASEIDFDWSGKEVELKFEKPFKPNRTYSITLTNALKDLRGNSLAKPYTRAFSTGDKIDTGSVAGIVFNAESRVAQGVTILAYLCTATGSQGDSVVIKADTLNPSKAKPDYISQTAIDGRFELRFLKAGHYKLFAITDADRSLVYKIGSDDFAVTPTPFVTIDSTVQTIPFRLSHEDTTKIEFTSAEAVSYQMFRVRADRPLVMDSLQTEKFFVYDSTAKKPVQLLGFYTQQDQSKGFFMFIAAAETLAEKHNYEFVARSLYAAASGLTPKAHIGFTGGSSQPDTAKLFARLAIADSAKSVFAFDQEKALDVEFTTLVNRASVDDAIQLSKSDGKNYQPIKIKTWFQDDKKIRLVPESGFELAGWYRIQIQNGKLKDVFGKAGVDTVLVRHFGIIGRDDMADMEGEVIDTAKSKSAKSYIITAEHLDQKKLFSVKVDKTTAAKSFVLPNLPEGTYLVRAFRDDDSSGTWSAGRAFPYQPPEPFVILPDTIRIRKRWTVENIKIDFNERQMR